jgi:hypothetical protein
VTIEEIRSFLGWCTVLDYGVLLVWALMFLFAHDWMRELHGRWFAIPEDRFDTLHYGLMGAYKLLLIVFNLAPWLALHIVA